MNEGRREGGGGGDDSSSEGGVEKERLRRGMIAAAAASSSRVVMRRRRRMCGDGRGAGAARTHATVYFLRCGGSLPLRESQSQSALSVTRRQSDIASTDKSFLSLIAMADDVGCCRHS